MTEHSLRPVAQAVAGFFIALFAVTIPILAVSYEYRPTTFGSGAQSGKFEAPTFSAE
jgi:hypothetical protein